MNRGRKLRQAGLGLAVLVIWAMAGGPAQAQQDASQRYPVAPPAPGAGNTAQRPRTQAVNLRDIPVPGVQAKAIPVNPSDPIALVNNEPITRQQLADECVARKGKEILETMMRRKLIEQALVRSKMTVTAAEIDAEIDSIAHRFGLNREGWLRTLDKERGISPAQYARDIVYPALALKKLCENRVQVTPRDMQDAFEAQYGEKLRVRMILVDKQIRAMGIWEELHKNTGAFESIAKEQSMDPGSRSLGGLVAEPITRHAYPKNLSDAAFQQLVDGDSRDRDPTHKPKDGDITGPIQVGEGGWVILRREELMPASRTASLKDAQVRQNVYENIYQVKLKEVMEAYFEALLKEASIENRLTGAIKMANEELDPNYRVDGNVKLMGNKEGDGAATKAGGAAPAAAPINKIPPPVALSPEAAQQFRPLKPGGNPAAAPAPAGGGSQ